MEFACGPVQRLCKAPLISCLMSFAYQYGIGQCLMVSHLWLVLFSPIFLLRVAGFPIFRSIHGLPQPMLLEGTWQQGVVAEAGGRWVGQAEGPSTQAACQIMPSWPQMQATICSLMPLLAILHRSVILTHSRVPQTGVLPLQASS